MNNFGLIMCSDVHTHTRKTLFFKKIKQMKSKKLKLKLNCEQHVRKAVLSLMCKAASVHS